MCANKPIVALYSMSMRRPIYCLLDTYVVLVVEFSSREFTGSESSGFIEVIVRITGGTSTTPITVTITPSVQSPISAMGM